MTFEKDVMEELKTINGNVNDTKVATARIEGKLDTHEIQIKRNEKDIEANEGAMAKGDKANEKAIGKVDGKVNGMLLKVTSAATAAGAAAGAAINAIANGIKGG